MNGPCRSLCCGFVTIEFARQLRDLFNVLLGGTMAKTITLLIRFEAGPNGQLRFGERLMFPVIVRLIGHGGVRSPGD